jgi:hypothetical protein
VHHARPLVLSAVVAYAAVSGCSTPPVASPPPVAPTPSAEPVVASTEPGPPATIELGGGCEEAKNAYVKECQDRPASCADTSKPAGTVSYGAILNDGAFLGACKSPPSTAVKICAAIRRGHAVAVTVTTTPGDARLSGCIGKAVQAIDFPVSPRLDVTSTTFAGQ